MKRLLTFLVLVSSAHAVGVVQTSLQQLSSDAQGRPTSYVAAFNWTGDASTGSVPSTQLGLICCTGWFVTTVEFAPGTPSPTNGYAATMGDSAGADILAGAASNLSATVAQSFAAATGSSPIQGAITLNITGQSVAGAKGAVYVFINRPGVVNTAKVGSNFSGVLGVVNGGTGVSSPTAHTVPVAEGSTQFAFAGPGTAAQPLVSNGAAADPTYQVLPAAGGGTGVSSPAAHTVPVAEGAGAFTFAGPGTTGKPLTSNGASSDPTYQTLPPVGGGTGVTSLPWVYVALAADGSTNDQPALQSAINTLSAGNGGTILLPSGNILLSVNSGTELLKFPGPGVVNLVGAGWNSGSGSSSTILEVASGVAATVDVIHIVPGTSGMTGMVLRDFGIAAQSGTPGRHGINIDSTSFLISYLLINHLYIGPLGSHGIVSTNPSLTNGFFDSTIMDSVIYNGMQFNRLGDAIRLFRNAFLGSNIGVEVVNFVNGAAHLDMYDNLIETTTAFIKLGDFTQHAIIRDNYFEPSGAMTGSNGAAIDFDGGSNQGIDIQFTGNSMNLNVQSVLLVGVRINNMKGVYLNANDFIRTASGGGVDWMTTASAVDTYVDRERYTPVTDVFGTAWTDAGSTTTVASRCDVYTVSGASLTSASNSQTINLFNHPVNSVFAGIRTNTLVAFTATNLLTLTVSIGDDCCSNTYFTNAGSITSTSGQVRTMPALNTTNAFTSHVTANFVGTYSSGGNFSIDPVSGSEEIDVCWGIQPMTGQK